MPRVDPTEYQSLPLAAFELTRGFRLHDVWLVELEGSAGCTIQQLRALITPERLRSINPLVRALFWARSMLGRLFRLDRVPARSVAGRLVESVPERLAERSLVPPGTPAGPFTTLYALPAESAYQALNATVNAILVTAVTPADAGHRFFWATYIRPVGRITALYMRLIDPFRRTVVYPGLESFLKRAWRDRSL